MMSMQLVQRQPAMSTVSRLTAGREDVRQTLSMTNLADIPPTAFVYASANQPHYLLVSVLSAVVID